MRVREMCVVVFGAAAVAGLPKGPVQAGDQYQSTIVAEEAATNTSDFGIAKPGSKFVIKPSTKAGDSGVTMQMVLANVNCPNAGNDGGKVNSCGSKGAAPGAPTRNHVVEIGARALGLEIPSAAGITYRLEKGKGLFEATGKNTVSGGQAFGALANGIQGHPLGVGLIRLHAPGTNPADCTTVPLADGNGCTDGPVYGFAGIGVPQ